MAQTSFAKELLDLTIKEQASDLHISVGHPPILRVSGRLVPLVKKPVVSAQDADGQDTGGVNKLLWYIGAKAA